MDYIPLYSLEVFFIAIIGLAVKDLLVYIKYVLIKLGRLKSPYKLNWQNSRDFVLGTDMGLRIKGIGASFKIFKKHQQTEILGDLSRSFRRGMYYLGSSVALTTLSFMIFYGRDSYVVVGIVVATIVAVWGILKI